MKSTKSINKDTQTSPEEITKLQQEIQNLDASWKRALADYQNLLKRVESDKKDFIRYSTANLVSKFLPSLDILELAATHSGDQGVQMAVKQFHDVLVSEGLEIVSPKPGDTYDHTLHECIETISGQPDNTIAEILSKGYKIGDFVIRPSKVKVFKHEQQ
jgi:molecular chaperone GrpE